jgi:hypothetical protein
VNWAQVIIVPLVIAVLRLELPK